MRCQVTMRSSVGQTRKLHVLTWLGPEKAAAMAAYADGHGYGTADGIYDIEVEELDPERCVRIRRVRIRGERRSEEAAVARGVLG